MCRSLDVISFISIIFGEAFGNVLQLEVREGHQRPEEEGNITNLLTR